MKADIIVDNKYIIISDNTPDHFGKAAGKTLKDLDRNTPKPKTKKEMDDARHYVNQDRKNLSHNLPSMREMTERKADADAKEKAQEMKSLGIRPTQE